MRRGADATVDDRAGKMLRKHRELLEEEASGLSACTVYDDITDIAEFESLEMAVGSC